MEGGVRGLKKRIDSVCRAIAVKLARGHQEKIVIQASDLPTLLDMKPLHHEKLTVQKNPGIVTGLAWTASGGEILFVETLLTKGSGQLICDGTTWRCDEGICTDCIISCEIEIPRSR